MAICGSSESALSSVFISIATPLGEKRDRKSAIASAISASTVRDTSSQEELIGKASEQFFE